MRTAFFLPILYLLFQSCSSNQVYLEREKQLLAVPSAPSKSGYFTNHFELAEVVPIQTCDTCLISNIKKLIRYQEKIILLSGSNNTVYIINAKNGKVEGRINKTGRGPGESNIILDIAFDRDSKQILVYNDYSRLLSFDFQGRFISEVKLNDQYEGIACHNNKVIFYNKLEGYSCYPYLFNILNLTDKTSKEVGDNKKVDFPIRGMGRHMVMSKQLWYTAPLDFKLYSFDDKQLSIPYELSIANHGLKESLIKKSISNPKDFFEEIAKNNLIYSINSVRETSRFLVFRSNQDGVFIVDKNENKAYWDEFIEEQAIQMKLNSYFPHEGDDEMIMFILHPENNIPISPQQNKSAQKMKEGDNPLLLFYRPKE
jgi:hypothetical protein